MLYGTGQKAELQFHGIALEVELTGVGENLQEHPRHQITRVIGLAASATPNLAYQAASQLANGRETLSSNIAEGEAVPLSNLQRQKTSQICNCTFVLAKADDHLNKTHYGYGYACHVSVS